MTDTLVWIRCSGCNHRRKARAEGNIGYYHDHWNDITGGRAQNVLDEIKDTTICIYCTEIIHLSDTGEWFHEIPATSEYDDITGRVECTGFTIPSATPTKSKIKFKNNLLRWIND